MTKVINCSGMGEEVKKELKPIEFTHFLCENSCWIEALSVPSDFAIVRYMGKNKYLGDMFSVSICPDTDILIYKGHYNDGVI